MQSEPMLPAELAQQIDYSLDHPEIRVRRTRPQRETAEITGDPEVMKALGLAENEVVLAKFKAGIINLAYEAEVWGSEPLLRITDAQLFDKVGKLLMDAMAARVNIRRTYKVDLL